MAVCNNISYLVHHLDCLASYIQPKLMDNRAEILLGSTDVLHLKIKKKDLQHLVSMNGKAK